jgi:4-amino-4-deoxy-L-arabinose transferase-like glycosyltransferase
MSGRTGWGVASGGAVLLVAALLGVAGRTTLWDRDEPRFATATVEMVRSGNYLYPTFNGELRPDKPILIYWLMSVPVRLFGTGEVALRAVAAIGMAIAALATYAAGRWLFNSSAGLLAAGILVTTPLGLLEGAAATTDAVLLAWITIAMAAFVHAFLRGWGPVHIMTLALVFGAGLLTKGPVGLIVPLASISGAWWLGRSHRALQPRHLAWLAVAVIIGVGVFLAWAIPANAATGGDLARAGIGHHIVRRIFEPLEGHGGPLLLFLPYYLVVVAAGFFPWTLYLGGAISTLGGGRLGVAAGALLLGWIAPGFVLMTVVATKLPHYVLPIWPALALAVAGAVDAARRGVLNDRDRRWLKRGAWLAGAAGACIGIGLLFVPRWLPAPGLAPWAVATAFIMLVITGLGVRELTRGHAAATFRILLVGMVCFDAGVALGVAPALDRLKPSPALAEAIRSQTEPSVPVVTYGYGEPSLVFYLAGRRVQSLPDDSALAEWARSGNGVLVAPRDVHARFEARGVRQLAAVGGYNFGNGKWVDLIVLIHLLQSTPSCEAYDCPSLKRGG